MADLSWDELSVTNPTELSWDSLSDKPPESKARGWGGVAKDIGITALKSAISVPESAIGLADIVTGGHAGKVAEEIGFRPKEAKDILSQGYSDEQKKAFDQVQQAKGLWETTKAAFNNPSVIAHTVGESIAPMLAGGVVGRGAAAIGKLGSVSAGAIGEGVMGAGSFAEQVRQQTGDGLLTAEQSGLALGAGALTTAFGALGAKVAKSLGIADVDTMLIGAAKSDAVGKGVTRRMLEGALSEGLLEELPQSVSEQVLQNKALGKPLDEGIDQAIVLGTLSGGLMGGGAAAFGGSKPPSPTPTPEPDQLRIGNTPDPMIGFPDGTVARRSEVEAYINTLPEDQRVAARAKLQGLEKQPAKPDDILKTESADDAISAFTESVSTPVNVAPAISEEDDLAQLVQSEARNLQVMRAQMDQDRAKQAELDQIPGIAAEQNVTQEALQRAASLDAPTAMGAAFGKLFDNTLAPEPEAPPAPAPKPAPEPRIVERQDGMIAMPRELAELRVEMNGGEVVRMLNRNGKYAFTVLADESKPSLARVANSERANVSTPDPLLPSNSGRGEQDGIAPAESMGDGASIERPIGVQPGGLVSDSVDQPGELPGEAPRSAVDERFIPKSKRNVTNTQAPTNGTETQAARAETPAPAAVDAAGQPATRAEAGAGALAATGVKPIDRRLTPVSKRTESTNAQTPKAIEASTPAQTSQAEVSGPVGRNNVPLSEGGKPYKTKLGADTARKTQPMMRVQRVAGGYALIEKTPAQIAAQEKAAKRLSQPRTSPKGEPIPAHAMIAAAGGLHPDTRADMGMQGNVNVGNRKLFAGVGRGLTIEQATEKLIEEGYLQEGASHDQARDLIKRSLTNPQYTPEGTERMAEKEMQEREKAFNDEQEALALAQEADDTEYEATVAAFEAAMLNEPQAEAQGDMSMEDALLAADYTEQEIDNERSETEAIGPDAAAAGALAQDGQGAAEATPGRGAQDGQGRDGAAREDQGGGEGLTLTAPSRREVIAQQDAIDAEAKRKEEGGDKPIPRRQLTGDIPDLFNPQGSVFDVPAEPEAVVDPISQSVQALADAVKGLQTALAPKVEEDAAEVRLTELLQAPTKSTGKPAVAFGTQREENEFKRGYRFAIGGGVKTEQQPGVPAKEQKYHDAFANGFAYGARFLDAKPDNSVKPEAGGLQFSRTTKDGKSSVLSKNGKFQGWPKFNTWTRQEYTDVVSLLPQEYRGDSYRREPLSTEDRDAHTAAALSEIKALNEGIGDRGFGVDGLGNLTGDMRDGITTRDLLKAADIADRHGLGVFVTGIRTGNIQALLDVGYVSEYNLGGVLQRAAGTNQPARPMPTNIYGNTAYGTMMAYKPRGFAMPMFARGPWRSALRDGLANINAKALSPEMWADGIKGLVNKGAAKADEVEWSGITDWLKLQTGRVTKEQVMAYLDGNGVQVQEVVNTDNTEALKDWPGNKPLPANTKYSQYQLPGGSNYREVLLTLPVKTVASNFTIPEHAAWVEDDGDFKLVQNDAQGNYKHDLTNWRKSKELAIAEVARANGLAETKNANYKSTHWDQTNVLAHVRLNDRVDADGKRVLFVEELQSDWQQQARKDGIKGATPTDDQVREYFGLKEGADPADYRQEMMDTNKKGVPNAPFINKTEGWLNLALKRIITMAVEGGYDRVAFVNGEQSADRYDLSKSVSDIQYTKEANGKYYIVVGGPRGGVHSGEHTASELEDYVGKELAQRIVDRADDSMKELTGLDLKVGGDGMRTFYDRIVPNTVNALLKKLGGGKMETVELQLPGQQAGERDRASGTTIGPDGTAGKNFDASGFTLTPAMIEKASQGLPLFDKQGGQSKPTGLTPTQFTAELTKAFGAKVAERLQAKGVVVPLADQSKLPAHVVPFLRDGDIIFGFFDPRSQRTYAVLENLTPEMVKGLVLHEVGVHFGFKAMLGDAKYANVMTRLDVMRRAGNKAVKEAYAEAQKNSVRDSQVGEETLAYLVQSSPEMGIIKEIIARIKAFLFSEFGIGGKYLTEADLTMLARAAVDHSSRVEDGGSVVPAFMRGTNDAVTNTNDVVGNQGGRSADDTTPGAGNDARLAASKVRNPDGSLKKVYHGTPYHFDGFSLDEDDRNVGGIWLTDSGNYAYDMSKGDGWDSRKIGSKGRVISAYLASENPMVLDVVAEAKKIAEDIGVDSPTDSMEAQELLAGSDGWDRFIRDTVNDAKRKGHDSLVIENFSDGRMVDSTAYVIFDPSNIVVIPNESTAPDSGGAKRGLMNLAQQDNFDPDQAEAQEVQSAIEGGSMKDAAKWLVKNGTPVQKAIAERIVLQLDRLTKAGIQLDLRVVHRGELAPIDLLNARGLASFKFDNKTGNNITVILNGADVEGKIGTSKEILLHELVHAATMGVVHLGRSDASSRVAQDVKDLREISLHIARHFDGRLNEASSGGKPLSAFETRIRDRANNAFTSLNETLAWALSNPDAQVFLEGIPYKNNQSTWSAFVTTIRNLLGLPAKLDSALSEVLRVADNLMSDRIDDVIRMPGIGEQMAYQTGINEGMTEAIDSNGAFARKVDQAETEANPDIRFSRTQIVGQTNRQHTPEQLRAMKNVGFQVEVPTLKERAQELYKDAGKKLAQGIVDQFAPVKDLDKNAYGLLRLAKGASGAFESFLRGGKLKITDGVYDFDDANKGGVVDKLLIPLGGEHHDFMRWIAANRAERLQGEGRENLFSPQDIADLKTLASGTTDFDYTIQTGPTAGRVTRDRTLIYADANRVFNEFNKNILDMAEQSGLIDGASRKVWEHEFYVPFYRVADEDGGGVRGMSVKGSVLRQQAFKELKGGKNALNADLLDNTLMNWAHLLDASAKNRAAKATIEAAERMGVATGGNQSTLASMGASVNNKNGVVWFMDGGVKRYSLIDNQGDGPYLMTAINALEYAGMRNPVMNAMGTMKHILTVGVTASPFFKIRNLIRDSVQVIGTSGINPNPAVNIGQGWNLTDPKSDAYFRLLAGGGTIHFGTMLEGSEAKRVQALVESGVKDSTILNSEHKVKAFYRKFIEPSITAYNELGNRGEAINRASLYDQLRKQGVNHADASLQARDLMDFSMQGSFTSIRFLTQVVPFLNARLQGLYKLGRAAKEDPARFSMVLGTVAAISLGLLAAYGDDDDWKKREEWDRNNFWWFKVGGTAFRIPKPFEIGAIATLAERGFERAFDKEMTNKRFMNQVVTLLGDNLSMNPVPQLVKPMLDVYANKDSFSGRPIETMSMERLKSEYRFTDRTSMTARAASTGMNAVTGMVGKEALSPVQIDHMLRGYFGWLGAFIVGFADKFARPLTDQKEQASPDYWKVATGGMISGLEDAPSRYVSSMYEQAKTLEEAYGTYRMLVKEGKIEEAKDFMVDHKDELSSYKRVDNVKKAEAKFNERIRMIERSAMDSDAKRDAIRKIKEQKDRVARQLAPT